MKNKVLLSFLVIALICANVFAYTIERDESESDLLSQNTFRSSELYNRALNCFYLKMYIEARDAALEANMFLETEENYVLLSAIYEILGDDTQVLKTYNELIELGEEKNPYYYARAVYYVKNEQFDLAQNDLNAILENDDTYREAYLLLMNIAIEQEDSRAAYGYGQKLMDLGPTQGEYNTILQMASVLGEYNDVIYYCEEYTDFSQSDEAYFYLGNAYFMEEDYEAAVYTLLLSEDMGYGEYTILGYAYLGIEDYDNAELYLNKSLDLQYDEDVASVISQLQDESITLTDDDNEYLAYYYYSNGDYLQAAQYMTKYKASNPEPGQDYFIATCYGLLESNENALTYYTYSINKGEELGECSYSRGVIYLENGQYSEAVIDFQTAYDCDVYPDYSLYNQGLAYMNQSLFKESTQCFLKVCEISEDEELISKAEEILSQYYVT